MLDRIRLQNFKTHRDTEITLGRLTVLVGPNGAGKSSVLQAIEMAPNQPPASMAQLARSGEVVGKCKLEWSVTDINGVSRYVRDDFLRKPLNPHGANEFNTALLVPDPRRMAEPVPITTTTPRLGSDGTGLADVIAAMRDDDEAGFLAVQTALRAVVPQVERLSIKRIRAEGEQIGHALVFDVSGRKGIPADQMSGGTLLALAILALLHSPQRPRILLLDDIDHGLHPKAQWDLLKQLRRLLAQYPDLQIVATSHSPDLVDELDPSEVIVMALRADGTSAAKPLTACPREDMLGVLRAGQLWSAVGEDWVTADSPEPQTSPEPQA